MDPVVAAAAHGSGHHFTWLMMPAAAHDGGHHFAQLVAAHDGGHHLCSNRRWCGHEAAMDRERESRSTGYAAHERLAADGVLGGEAATQIDVLGFAQETQQEIDRVTATNFLE